MFDRCYVDINAELVLYESIIAKYVYSSIDWEFLYFVPFRRYPVTLREVELMGRHVVPTHQPHLPFLGVAELLEWVKNELHLNQALFSNIKSYYETNPILKKVNRDARAKSFLNDKKDILDYYNQDITCYLLEDEHDDLTKLYSICDTILGKFEDIASKYTNRIFDIDASGPMIELINLSDIYQYRYKEMEKYVKRGRL